MAARIAQLSLFAVAMIIGILLVGQLRSQARPIELSSLSAQELSALVETISNRNLELADGLADLRDQIGDYERADVEGQSDLAISEEALQRIGAFGGLVAVAGQGIELEIEGAFDATAVNDLLYELRNAGAEAISIDDVRITAASVATLGPRAITVDDVEIGSSFVVRAIGSPDGLRSAIERPGGLLTLLEQSINARFSLDEVTDLVVPATERDLAPQAASAVE
jgi:uncharacterized protein YlxW (UPF0749 family)